MLSLLLSMAVVTPIPVVQPPPSSPQICDELLYELEQGVKYKVITGDQALEVYLRCVVKYL